MATDTIPSRSNGQTIDQTWFNILRTVLSGDVVGRVGGVATTGQALGTAVYRWGNLSLEANIDLYNTSGTLLYRFTQSSGDYVVQDGSGTEIARLTSEGWDARSILGRNLNQNDAVGSSYPESKDVHYPAVTSPSAVNSATFTATESNMLYTKLNVVAPVGGTAVIWVGLIGESGSGSYIQWRSAGSGTPASDPSLQFHFNASPITADFFGIYNFGGITDEYLIPSAFSVLTEAAAGDQDIYVDLVNFREDTIDVERIRLAAYQL